MTHDSPLPLEGVRIVEDAQAEVGACGRFLAELGAEVVLVEAPGGAGSRRRAPMSDGIALTFQTRHSSKRSIVLDTSSAADRAHLLDLLNDADMWIASADRGPDVFDELAPANVIQRSPHLVIGCFSSFGLTGPRSRWKATDWTLLALGGQLHRSGVPGRPPLMPPDEIVDEAAAIQAAWTMLVAYWSAFKTGVGDVLDISRHEAVAQILDPALGSIGTAAAASAGNSDQAGRSSNLLYPIFECADGHVRFAVLAPKQWHRLREWLGEPPEFSDTRFDELGARYAAADTLYPLIATLVRDKSGEEIVAEAQRRGIPVAPVLTPAQALASEHFRQRRLFTDVALPDGRVGQAPTGHLLIDGRRAGHRWTAPALDDVGSEYSWRSEVPARHHVTPRPLSRPLEGLRVLDLGVIVMGGEAGRMFADQGAEVIKVENRRFPDGARLSPLNPRFAAGQRNKHSFGVNLRDPEGKRLFEHLVAQSDVLLSNFRPGTLESLGLSVHRLREINPQIVVVTSSAMGESGPWRDWMGYGPLVRSVCGLTSLWKDDGVVAGFGDTSTIYPDHFVARIVAAGTLAALVRRRATGIGAHLESSQAEAAMIALAPRFLHESLEPGAGTSGRQREAASPWGIFACHGDDEWCAITVGSDSEWQALVGAIGSPPWATDESLRTSAGRRNASSLIDERLGEWTSTRSPLEVASALQAVGVTAAPVQRGQDQVHDPHLNARSFFRRFHQPGLAEDVAAEARPCPALHMPDPPSRPAPFYGEHTRDIARGHLGLTDGAIDRLVHQGVLDEMSEHDLALRAATARNTDTPDLNLTQGAHT